MKLNRLDLTLALAFFIPAGAAHAQSGWLRGNTHVHTIHSDGTATPDRVARWYREHDYDFVVITDHDLRTPVAALNARYGTPGQFLVLPGVEVTDRFDGRPVHLNGVNVTATVLPQGGGGVVEIINRDARSIKVVGGLPIINHPNGLLRAALTADDLSAVGEASHFEICCADYRGGSGHPSTDELWDAVLSTGRLLYGVAADDAHDFGPESRQPGSAWIMVRAPSLTSEAIIAALAGGDFYATTGVTLADLRVTNSTLCLELADAEDYGFRTIFIGQGGEELNRDETTRPCYQLQGEDLYVRARVYRSDGAEAWTQPLFRN